MVCAEKICSKDLHMDEAAPTFNVNEAIYKGLGKVVHRYRTLFADLE